MFDLRVFSDSCPHLDTWQAIMPTERPEPGSAKGPKNSLPNEKLI
jgi:hypothetical protein